MKEIRWNPLKNLELKQKRGISFEEILESKLIGVVKHPHRAGQRLMLFEHGRYVWVVPYVENKEEIFLKTLFPSRKYFKLYYAERQYEKDETDSPRTND